MGNVNELNIVSVCWAGPPGPECLPVDTTLASASGEYGLFEGIEGDRVVFGRYRSEGTWSPELVRLLSELLGTGGTLLDVGANIGLICIPVVERTSAHCLAFEPAPENFACLERNLRVHGLARRVEAHRLALYSESARLPLNMSEDNSGDHHLEPSAESSVMVEARPLDGLLAGRQLPAPVVMKLDVQGAELRVLKGAAASLAMVDTLIVEYWPAGLRRMGDSAEQLAELLCGAFGHGARLGAADAHLRLHTAEQVFEDLSWVATDGSDEGFFDLLFTH